MHSAAPPLRLHRRDLGAGAAVLGLVAILTVLTFFDIYGDALTRRARTLMIIAAAGLLAAGCATSATDLVKAANDLDPGCYKNVRIDIVPMFGFVAPVGHYEKTCNPDQATPLQRVTIVPAPTLPDPAR